MGWRETIRPNAAFRGTQFHCVETELAFGRRVDHQMFPLRERGIALDMGADDDVYTLQAFVLGEDYLAERDRLEKALRQAGPGLLVHPWRGDIQVQIQSVKAKEGIAEQGVADFTITCVVADETTYPVATPDHSRQVVEKAAAADNALAKSFSKKFTTAGQPDYVIEDALKSVEELSRALSSAAARVAGLPAQGKNIARSLSAFRSAMKSRIQAPSSMGNSVLSLINDVPTQATPPQAALPALRSLQGFSSASDQFSATPQDIVMDGNRGAVSDLVRGGAAVSMARTASGIEFTDVAEALAIRTEMAKALEGAADRAGAVSAWELSRALQDLEVASWRDITDRMAQLPQLEDVASPTVMSARALAWRQHGSLGDAERIAQRNRLSHPAFVPASRTVKVLRRG